MNWCSLPSNGREASLVTTPVLFPVLQPAETVTEKYVWEHLNEDVDKLDRYTWQEIMES